MNEWEIAAIVLTAAIVPCVGVCVFCTAPPPRSLR